MNDADIKNIKLIIESRKPIIFDASGNESIEHLQSLSTNELQKIIDEFETTQYNKGVIKFKAIIAEIFNEYACPDENVIILSEVCEDNCIIDPRNYNFSCINFTDVRKSEYNTEIQSPRWRYVDDVFLPTLEQKYKELGECLNSMKIGKVTDLLDEGDYGGDWYGYLAVNRNNELITFVCRDDNWLDGKPYIIKQL